MHLLFKWIEVAARIQNEESEDRETEQHEYPDAEFAER
jgi:hypothetical protein